MENVKPQRMGLVIGGLSVVLIVVMTYLLTSSSNLHPITPRDVKATLPANFTAAAASASAPPGVASSAPAPATSVPGTEH